MAIQAVNVRHLKLRSRCLRHPFACPTLPILQTPFDGQSSPSGGCCCAFTSTEKTRLSGYGKIMAKRDLGLYHPPLPSLDCGQSLGNRSLWSIRYGPICREKSPGSVVRAGIHQLQSSLRSARRRTR